MNITADAVKQLRERTGAGMMECKKALVEANGDLDTAAENMRKAGLAKGVGEVRDDRGAFGHDPATVNDRRRAGTDMSRVETATYVVDRQKALGFGATPVEGVVPAASPSAQPGAGGIVGLQALARGERVEHRSLG